MRSIDLRIPAIALAAVALVAVAPAFAAEPAPIQFVAGTGEAYDAPAAPQAAPVAPQAFAAQDADDMQADMTKMAAKLADPGMQDGIAAMVERMTTTMMNLPIGKLAATVEKSVPGGIKGKRGKRIREGDTVADLAGRNADRLPADLAKGSKQMMGMLSGFAAAFATMIPEFEKMGQELEKGIDEAKSARRD
jgi:hypothetical protein